MGQVKKEVGKLVSFSTVVQVNEDNQSAKINESMMNMVLLVAKNDRNFKDTLIAKLQE